MINYKTHIGIDFSYDTTKIYVHNKGIIYNEPTLMYYDKVLNRFIIGNQAKNDSLKNSTINLVNPLTDVLFVDLVSYCAEVVRKLKTRLFSKNIVVLSFPIDLNDEEEEIISKIVKARRRGQYIFMEPVYLEALGNNIDISSMIKRFIVLLNSAFSVATIISNNNINIIEKMPVDGRYIDLSVKKYLKMTYDIDVSLTKAHEIRNELSDLSGRVSKKISIHDIEITSDELRSIISEDIDRLCLDLLSLIDILSQSTFDAIKEEGIYLIGDTSNILGLAPYMENKLSMKVNIGPNTENGMIDGMINYFKNIK